jgi:hypothetical protein
MDNAVRAQLTGTSDRDMESLLQVAKVIPILADLSRADVLVGAPNGNDQILIVAHAKPHSIAPVHRESLVGQHLTRGDASRRP